MCIQINGLIRYFNLENWWLNDLTTSERERLVESFGVKLIQGEIHSTSATKLSTLCNMSSFWKPSEEDLALAKKIRLKAKTIKSTDKKDEFWLNWLIENDLPN